MDEEKITLDRFMREQAQPDVVYHIGSFSGFFFVGTRADYYELIDTIESMMVSDGECTRDNALNDYYAACRKLSRLITTPDFSQDDPNAAPVSQQIKTLALDLPKLYDRYIQTKEYLARFSPIRTRLILDTYPRLQGDGQVILVTGEDRGRFWDKKEFDLVWRMKVGE